MVNQPHNRPARATGPLVGATPELRHLRAFVAVAEELSFTRAAKRLYVAQQALSVQIRQLEEMFGGALFYRTTRRVQLTPSGETLLEYVPSVLSLLEEGWRSARGVADYGRAPVRVAYSSSITLVPAIIAAVQALPQSLSIKAQQVSRGEAVEGVRSGAFDLALVRTAPSPDSALEVSLVCKEPFVVTLGESHPLARRQTVTAGDLTTTLLTLWPKDHSDVFGRIVAAFAANVAAGLIYEYVNSSSEGFLVDAFARDEILAGRAFAVRVLPHGVQTPVGYADLVLEPTIAADLYLVRKRSGQAPLDAGRDSAARTVAETIHTVAYAIGSSSPIPA